MVKSIFILFFTTILFSSCQTTRDVCQAPDTYFYPKEWSNKFEDQKKWVSQYNQSLKNKSCNDLDQLAKNSEFILKNLALIKLHLVCPEFSSESINEQDLLTQDPWLRSLNLERKIKESTETKNEALLADALIEKSRYLKTQNEKIEMLQNAINLYKKLNDKKNILLANNELIQTAPRLNPSPDSSEWYKVAYDFLLQRDFLKSRKYLNKIILNSTSKVDEKYQAYKLYRYSYKLELDKETFLKICKTVNKWVVKNTANYQWWNDSVTTYARAVWTEGQSELALKTLIKAATVLKGKYPLSEIYWIIARIFEERKDYNQALSYLSEAQKDLTNSSDYFERVTFSKAWMLLKIKKFEEATLAFNDLYLKTEDPFAKIKYLFWQASTNQNDSDSKKLYTQVTQEDPLGYYGLISYYKLKQKIPALQKQNVNADLDPSVHLVLDFNYQTKLRALVLTYDFELIESFFNSNSNTIFSSIKNEIPSQVFILKNLAAAGLYQPLFAKLGELDPVAKKNILHDYPELLFPTKYQDLIDPNAEKFNIDPSLVFSIIRQESAFNPYARSPADAFGLMQLIPSVAKLQEKNTGLYISHQDDLYRPEINIPMGISFLSQLVKKYDNRILLAAAAYNANEKAINGWLESRYNGDPIEFIEDVPYEETRNYMKLILRNFVFYSRIKNSGNEINFPNWALQFESKTN